MLSVPAIAIPSTLDPTVAALREDELHYNPEFWELTYGGYRYLRNATLDVLFERHEAIATNFRVFGTTERLRLRWDNVFSAWYWLRKEHQLRFEMHLRGYEPRIQVALSTAEVPRPVPRPPKKIGDILFRF